MNDDNIELGCKDRANNTCNDSGSSNYCTNDCIAGCSSCHGTCGAACEGQSTCDGCTGSCSSSCTGSCRGGCSGCRGTCQGGCQGSCQGRCDKGCTSQEQEDNAKVTLDRVVNVENIKNIFKFVVYEARRRAKHPYYKGDCKGKESQFDSYAKHLNKQTATDPMKYNNILFTPYTTPILDENGNATEEVNNGYVEKELTEPLTISAYKELYIDNEGKVQYGFKDINGISHATAKTFHIGTFDSPTELANYFFNLNENGEEVVSRYINAGEGKIAYQKYYYNIELKKDQSDKIFLLYYNIPRLFENTLNLMDKKPDVQSGTLVQKADSLYYPDLIGRNDNHYDYYAKITAKYWIEMARELYNEVLGYNDARN